MSKNITIGALILVIVALGGYVFSRPDSDSLATPDQSESTQTDQSVSQAQVQTQVPVAPSSGFMYYKGVGPLSGQLVFTDAGGVTKTNIGALEIYQGMDARPGELLLIQNKKKTSGPGYDSTLETMSPAGAVHVLFSTAGLADPSVEISGARFNPDGKQIVYIIQKSTYQGNSGFTYTESIHQIQSDGTGDVELASNIDASLNSDELFTLVGVGADNKAYFTLGTEIQAGSQSHGLFAFDLSQKTMTQIDSSSEIFFDASVSPDGKALAYIPYAKTSEVGEWTPVSPYEIKKLDLSTYTKTILMTGSRPYESFKWSPDSSKILFVTDKKNGVYDLALGTSTEFGFEGDVIGWASNTNLVYVVLTENSPSTNADNVYNLRTASYLEQQNSTDIDTKVGPGVFSFVGAF